MTLAPGTKLRSCEIVAPVEVSPGGDAMPFLDHRTAARTVPPSR
jgi:hypothetical protein